MDLGTTHQISPGSLGPYTCHVRHPEELGSSRPRHSQPAIVSLPQSPPSRHSFTKETLRGGDKNFKVLWGANRTVTNTVDARQALKPWAPKRHESSQKEDRHEAGVVHKRGERRLTAKQCSGQPDVEVKRVRSSDDVDGPGTAALSCKKRRLLRYLVTSRLSCPFSLPATHILIRESRDGLHRIQQLAALGARRTAGQQGALLVRKTAILNRMRIVSRGHAAMTALDGGLLLVTKPSSSATFPVADVSTMLHGHRYGPGIVPPAWRPPINKGLHQKQQHDSVAATSCFDAHRTNDSASGIQGGEIYNCNSHSTTAHIRANTHRCKETPTEPSHSISSVVSIAHASADVSDEEDNTAFPAANFRDQYTDFSDDEVYADFGILFARSPDGSSVEDQFYEEYLDGLDGIPWVV